MASFTRASLVPALALAAWTGNLAPLGGRALAAAAWLGIGPMALAFVCWDRALALGRAQSIGVLSYLDPLLSTLTVSLALHQPLTGVTWLGMFLIMAGAALPSLRGRSRP
jgi:drug/metabolite transporter (DMT)-like permease